ncbi:30S ribosomal protein S3 [Thiotrichales bacterium 19X7-9]|nr:30S ribosomal protein S3 [Thiotrichales bacterium 19X7-9]
MGQKVSPVGIRLGYIKDWNSVWYADSKDYATKLHEDIKVREYLHKKLKHAALSHVKIERPAQNAKVTLYTARPGIVIGKKGEDVEILRAELNKFMGVPVQVNIEEIKKPETDAQLVADGIAQQLEKRVMFRRAMKRAIQAAMKAGAQGVKVMVSGRLGGAEIARSEWAREGRVPLHTFRADIDYATSEALTTYGIIGVKVWIFKGEVIPGERNQQPEQTEKKAPKRRSRRGAN